MFCQLISFTRVYSFRKATSGLRIHTGTWHSGASSGLDQAGLAGPFFHPFWVAEKNCGKILWIVLLTDMYTYLISYIYRYRCYDISCVYYNTSKRLKDTSFVKNTSFIFSGFHFVRCELNELGQNADVGVFNGVMWEPPPSARYVMRHARWGWWPS